MKEAIENHRIMRVGTLTIFMQKGILFIELPSGRRLSYVGAAMKMGEKGYKVIMPVLPTSMTHCLCPPELQKAHQENDKALMEAYDFDWHTMKEEDCVAELMKMYQRLVDEEKVKDTIDYIKKNP